MIKRLPSAMRVRFESDPSAHPENVLWHVTSEMDYYKKAVGYHFKNRHTTGNQIVKMWVDACLKFDKKCGYAVALREVARKRYS